MRTETPTILIVDDQPENLAVLAGLLQPNYRVRAARSGEQALRAAATEPKADLALLDIMMPEMDGFALLAKLRENATTADIPVIFITALGAGEDEQRGFAVGAVDYITKPIRPATVLARVRTHVELKEARDRLKTENELLERKVAERTEALDRALQQVEAAHAKLKKTHFGTLVAISDLTGLRAAANAEHSRRVADLARQVAARMGMSPAEAQDVFIAGLLHDAGKIGFPDGLLKKPVSALTGDERRVYQLHPDTGADLIGKIDALSGIADLIRSHHELYNGSGFPRQLSGLNIPLGARIICAISDYEDLKSGALGGRPWSAKRSGQYLVECAGSRYDPQVIEVLEPILANEGQYEIDEIRVNVRHLQEGMVLTRDVRDHNGFVLLSRGTALSRHLIDQLVAVEERSRRNLMAHVDRAVARREVDAMPDVPPPGEDDSA